MKSSLRLACGDGMAVKWLALEQHRAVHHELPNEGITSFKLELVC
jgi:hypothetical protein